ncbi:hypothetical protein [Clostridium tertium]|uniref:hypothetical protein n=1 Tax=Clostridium tertium TaxID=1559 RepID=UPI0023B30DEF|nr:hypothetical protein [Clostridium tertium]
MDNYINKKTMDFLKETYGGDVQYCYGNLRNSQLESILSKTHTDFNRIENSRVTRPHSEKITYKDFLKENPWVLRIQRENMIQNALLAWTNSSRKLHLINFILGNAVNQEKTSEILFDEETSVLYENRDFILNQLNSNESFAYKFSIMLCAFYKKYRLTVGDLAFIILNEHKKNIFVDENGRRTRTVELPDETRLSAIKVSTVEEYLNFLDIYYPDYKDLFDCAMERPNVFPTEFAILMKKIPSYLEDNLHLKAWCLSRSRY